MALNEFWQFTAPTRVVAGMGLVDGTGFEFAKEGAKRPGAALAEWVRELRGRLGLPARLSEVGVPEDGIGQLADDAMGEGSTLVNPREPSEEDFAELYRRVL